MAPKEDIQKAEIIELVNALCGVVIELNSLQSYSVKQEEGKRVAQKWIHSFNKWGWINDQLIMHEIKWRIINRILNLE